MGAVEQRQLVLIGGKGGVGKTTVAAATALHLGAERSVLLASTDPAHSLGDALQVDLAGSGSEPRGDTPHPGPVTLRPGLAVWELDAARAAERFFDEHRGVLRTLIERGTFFDEQDIDRFLTLSLPGIDEVMATLQLARLVRERRYDSIVVDTAPTGHTMRLLRLPEDMREWLRLLELMQHRHHYMLRRFSGRDRRDAGDRFIEQMMGDLEELASLLTDERRCAVLVVCIPEPMVVSETARLLEFLSSREIAVDRIVVNRVPSPPEARCVRCSSRLSEAERELKTICERFARYDRVEIPLLLSEPQGLQPLAALGAFLFGGPRPERPLEDERSLSRSRANVSLPASEDLSELLERPLELVLFGGKGGVGKTSLSTAFALSRARRHPEQRILLFSTDPAHSIGDSLDRPIGAEPVELGCGRLSAIQIDAAALLDAFKQDYRASIEHAFLGLLGSAVDLPFDRPVIEQLLAASPPGLDELMALIKVLELRSDFDLFILDTAPTGHLLRFLGMPELFRSWLQIVFRVLLKYRDTLSFEGTSERLLDLSRQIRQIRVVLENPDKTTFVAVAAAEALSVRETPRLIEGVRAARLSCLHLIVNMVLPASSCGFCEARRHGQAACIEALRAFDASLRLTLVPLFDGAVRGSERLAELADTLFGAPRTQAPRTMEPCVCP